MRKYNHIVDRNIVKWTSFGINGDEPPRKTLIKDLSDSHLMNIINWIGERHNSYGEAILNLMIQESDFRGGNTETHNLIMDNGIPMIWEDENV
jgi:hypothetical protein